MQATELKQAVVLGAGQMGAGIAQVMAVAGIDTLEAADGAEFVVEAVVENEAAKVEIFRKLHTILPPRPFFLPTPRASTSPAWGPKPGARPSSWACTS